MFTRQVRTKQFAGQNLGVGGWHIKSHQHFSQFDCLFLPDGPLTWGCRRQVAAEHVGSGIASSIRVSIYTRVWCVSDALDRLRDGLFQTHARDHIRRLEHAC